MTDSLRTPFEISDSYTDAYCDLSPLAATFLGIPGYDHRWPDMSPEGIEAMAALARATAADMKQHLGHPDPVQAHAAKVMASYLEVELEEHQRGEWKRNINHLASPYQGMLAVFDLMPRKNPEQWSNVVRRLATMEEPIEGYIASLQVGLDEGMTAAQRQVASLIDQARAVEAEDNRFAHYASEAPSTGGDADEVAAAVTAARAASGRLADWLEAEYMRGAVEEDAVGEERYQQALQRFLGLELDLIETYEWGWSEIHRLMDAMKQTASDIEPGKNLEEVIHLLDNDPERSAPSHDAFAEFVLGIQRTAVEQLSGSHFDVPDEISEVTVSIAPPGGSLGAWYVGPSEDFSRPGSIWYALGERKRIPYWQEVSIAYHEGFPGHHIQVGTATLKKDQLARFHRLGGIWYPGSGEGWALYAEQLMDELGYFENPEYRLGLLASQLFRSTRIAVDIGTQLELTLPEDAPLYAGETWNFDIAVDYMEKIGLQARDVAVSEVTRYLGWWGQAISYKVGEREILDIREDSLRKLGSSFDRKEFHRKVLEAGAVRLDHLREAVV